MALYAAIDLHSNNNVLAIIDADGKVLLRKRLRNELAEVAAKLEPFRADLAGVVVESTYNWYWLVDGLQDAGYRMHLANTAAVPQYAGLKHGDDDSDAEHLANLLRLGILPTGYIYPKAQRGLRDLMRQRLRLVQQSVCCVHSVQSLWARHTGRLLSMSALRTLTPEALAEALPDDNVRLTALTSLASWRVLRDQADGLEHWLTERVDRDAAKALRTAPGIGVVLSATIALECGPMARFDTVGDFASYCRMVDSTRLSNGKRKGHGNRKNGNRYLAWAFVEGANFALRYHQAVRDWYERKRSTSHRLVALKAVAHKLARGCYYVLRDGVPFDQQRAFGS